MKRAILKHIQLISLMAIAGLLACKPAAAPAPPDPLGYTLTAGEKFSMPDNLLEVSGITFKNQEADSIYAIQDEEGRLFSLKWAIKDATSSRFAPRGDYEDLAIMGNKAFVLKSSGDIYGFNLNMGLEDVSEQAKLWEDLLPKAEYESMYADEKEQSIYVLTKSAGKKKGTACFMLKYDPATNEFAGAEEIKVDLDGLEVKGKKLKSGFKASAFARNPVTKAWYILSSANKLLVVTNPDCSIKSVYDLDASTFNQPEGIAFDKDQNLYISNEGDEITNGNILKFNFNGSTK
jgi:hypothetical protein